jgi:hypothetical protein
MGSVKATIISRIVSHLHDAGRAFGLFRDVKSNPTEATLTDGVQTFRSGGYNGVVAVGGGSAHDVGKCIAFMATPSTAPNSKKKISQDGVFKTVKDLSNAPALRLFARPWPKAAAEFIYRVSLISLALTAPGRQEALPVPIPAKRWNRLVQLDTFKVEQPCRQKHYHWADRDEGENAMRLFVTNSVS